MLGDSLKRRQGGRAPRERKPRVKAEPGAAMRRLAWVLAALVVPFGLGYLIAAFILFPPRAEADGSTSGEGGIPVPSLVGRLSGDAERDVRALGLSGLDDVVELPHPAVPAGQIIAQDPLPGQHLRPGAGVRVAVSSGPPRAAVPDVVGFTAERARLLLTRFGFTVTEAVTDSNEPAGRVLRLSPGPGSEHRLPATIVLTVSAGPAAPDTTTAAIDSTLVPVDTAAVR